MTLNPVVIPGSYSPSFLRCPYAETRESLNPSIHAVAWNRSGNQSTRLAAPENRSQHHFRAAEAANPTVSPYETLTARS